MPLPALQKTWQGGSTIGGTQFVNQSINESSTIETHKEILFQIKNAMVNFAQNPWTVSGSSDGTTAGMDAVDRWTDRSKLTPGTGAHGWIVLRQSKINSKFEVCIDCNGSASFMNQISLVPSPANGFGSANGGTDGSVTARPTALDEDPLLSNQIWHVNISTNDTYRLSCIQSTDGECTRFVSSRQTTGQSASFFMGFEKPREPIPEWENPAVYWHQRADFSTTVCTYTDFYSTVNMDGTINKSTPNHPSTQFGLGTSTFGTSGWGQLVDTFSVTGEIAFSPNVLITTISSSGSGQWGSLFDLWWHSDNAAVVTWTGTVDSFPADGSRKYVTLGHFAIGWLNDSATDLILGP